MHGLFAPHARVGETHESVEVQGDAIVYDPEYPDWYLRR